MFLIALALGVWGGVLSLGLLGWDTYPLIATARTESATDLLRALGSELMDGRYPLGHYWRPVVHLSFALDLWLHGLDARGYHATDLALLVACALTLRSLALRLGASPAAALLAGAAWILHPVQIDVLTVPARRAETLAILFTLLALAALAHPAGRTSLARRFAVGLACAAALASKESGAVALPLVVVLALVLAQGRPRLAAVLEATWPAALLFLGALAWRTAVLGGLGGGLESGDAPLATGLAATPAQALRSLGHVLVPPAAVLGTPLRGHELAAASLIATAALAVLVLDPARRRRTVLLLAWVPILAFITGMSGVERDWYALPFAAPYALGLAWIADGARDLPSGRPRRAAAAAGLVACALVLGANARAAFRAPRTPVYRIAGEEADRLVDSFTRRVEGARPGETLRVEAAFQWDVVDESGELLRRVHPVGPYSLIAYAELVLPGRRLVLASEASSTDARDPSAVVVLAVPLPRTVVSDR